jgi:hypothetical protein
MKNLNYICVAGYGRSGSSACVALLKEFEGIVAVDGEFRIAKDPHGLLDLENSLVRNWDFMRNDIAIKDFLNYCNMLARDEGLLKRYGKGFNKKLDVDFLNIAENYINSLIKFDYICDSSLHRYDSSALRLFIAKIRSKFGKNNTTKTYYSKTEEDFFIKETRLFINNLLVNYLCNDNTIVLDQAISVANIENTIKYFNNSKVIVIDRDPRDTYIDLVNNNLLIGAELRIKDSSDKYIKWHKAMRDKLDIEVKNGDLSKIVLRLNYEELVYDYEQSVIKIIDFIGADLFHKDKFCHFDPRSNETKNNIGLWKKYRNSTVMNEISRELKQYCIDN